MVGRFFLAVLLADLIGMAGVLVGASAHGPPPTWDAITFFGSMAVILAAFPLAIGMGCALLILFKVDHPIWVESIWGAIGFGAIFGLLTWALLTGNRKPAIGIVYGAAAGLSLWLCLRDPFRAARAA